MQGWMQLGFQTGSNSGIAKTTGFEWLVSREALTEVEETMKIWRQAGV
jgi:hypothetical protein